MIVSNIAPPQLVERATLLHAFQSEVETGSHEETASKKDSSPIRLASGLQLDGRGICGLVAGGGIGHDRGDFRGTGAGKRELGIANSKRALGGDERLLILKAR
jgi:hypothetical protein